MVFRNGRNPKPEPCLASGLGCFFQKCIQIQRMREHLNAVISTARPLVLRPVPVQLHPVAVRVSQVNCLAHSVIRSAFQWNPRLENAPQRIRQQGACRIQNREMIQPRGSLGRRQSTRAFPRVQSDMMMIPARRDKRRALAVALGQFKPKHAAIKRQRPIQVRHFQMHVANPDFRIYRSLFHKGLDARHSARVSSPCRHSVRRTFRSATLEPSGILRAST